MRVLEVAKAVPQSFQKASNGLLAILSRPGWAKFSPERLLGRELLSCLFVQEESEGR